MSLTWILPMVGFSLSVALVGVVRRHALRSQILDHPNERSSHLHPVPRGGGLGVVTAIVLTFGVGAVASRSLDVPWVGLLPLLGIAAVCAVGWRDDRDPLGVAVRLAVHSAAALTLLPLVLWPTWLPAWMGLLGAGVWWVFWGVSAVNVVNFMDGIDGLVGSQALIFGLHLAVLAGPTGGAGLFGSTLVGAAAGFLLWNWAPAKVFLGDAGSGGLGLAMVLGGALLMREREVGLIVAFLPLYPLFLDATITRLLRVLYGKGLMSAHRAHLYQRLANGGWGHARVTLLYAAAAASGVVIAVLPSDRSSEWAAMAGYAAVVLVVGLWLGQRVSSDSG